MKEITKTDSLFGLTTYDPNEPFPDLFDDMDVLPINIVEQYWTPEMPGESKRVWYKGIAEVERQDEQTGDKYMAEVAFLQEQDKEGNYTQIVNQSYQLVATLKSYSPNIAFQITYLGKKKTQSGKNMDTWSIQPLIDRRRAYANLKKKPQNDDDDIFGEIN